MQRILFAFVLGALAVRAQPPASSQSPAVSSKCAPRYTEEARRAKLEGVVLLYIEVAPDGRARSIRVTRPLGMGLDESAVEAVQQWRFSPGKKDGKPITVAAVIEVRFRLDNRDEPCRAGPPQVEEPAKDGRA